MTQRAAIRVVRWTTYEEPLEESVGGLGGWFENGMRWVDFVKQEYDEARQYYEAIRADVLRLGLKRGGDWHQNSDDGVPVFSDNTCARFSYRAWGDMLAAIWSTEENIDHNYMHFYMDCMGGCSGCKPRKPKPTESV